MLGNYNLQDLPKEIAALIQSALDYEKCGNLEKAAEYFKLAAEATHSVEINPRTCVMLWRDHSMCHYHTHKPLECLKGLYIALDLLKEMKDKDEQCLYHIFLSGVYLDMNDLLSSLEELQSAELLLKEIDNEKMSTWVKSTWGSYYYAAQDPDRAINMHNSTLPYFTKENDLNSIGGMYLNIGLCYEMKCDYENSYRYFIKALTLSKDLDLTKNNNKRLVVKSKFMFGAMHITFKKNLDEAINVLLDGLNNSIEFSLAYDEAAIRKSLGEVYYLTNNIECAKEELLKAKELSISENNVKRKREILLLLANIEKSLNNTYSSLQYFTEYSESVVHEEEDLIKKRALELEIRLYKLEEKKKNELLEKELQINKRVNEAVTFQNKENEQVLLRINKSLSHIESRVGKNMKGEIKELQK